jgi:hypothetical protein
VQYAPRNWTTTIATIIKRVIKTATVVKMPSRPNGAGISEIWQTTLAIKMQSGRALTGTCLLSGQ